MEEGVLITNSVITRKQFDSGGSIMYLENEELDWGRGEEHPSPSSELVGLQTEEEKENKPLFETSKKFYAAQWFISVQSSTLKE